MPRIKDTVEYLKLDPWHFGHKPICSSVVIGFTRNGGAIERVLLPAAACAEEQECWQTGEIMNYDLFHGAVISMFTYNNTCYTCNKDFDYFAEFEAIPGWGMSLRTQETPTEFEEGITVELFYRGTGQPKSLLPNT